MKHLFVSMSVKQNLVVSVFVHKCLMMLNDVEYTAFKMFVTQMSNCLFVISFQLMLYIQHRSTSSNICEQNKTETKRFCFTDIETNKCFIKHCVVV